MYEDILEPKKEKWPLNKRVGIKGLKPINGKKVRPPVPAEIEGEKVKYKFKAPKVKALMGDFDIQLEFHIT
jgi:hypothetical protein